MRRTAMPHRRAPLRSRTPLRRVALKRKVALRPYRVVGLRPGMTDVVLGRDQHSCVRCGRSPGEVRGVDWSIHHRRRRNVAGPDTHLPGNLVTLCGSGTTGCHGWAHAHPVLAGRLGLVVSVRATPSQVPLTAWYGRVLLDDGGGLRLLPAVLSACGGTA